MVTGIIVCLPLELLDPRNQPLRASTALLMNDPYQPKTGTVDWLLSQYLTEDLEGPFFLFISVTVMPPYYTSAVVLRQRGGSKAIFHSEQDRQATPSSFPSALEKQLCDRWGYVCASTRGVSTSSFVVSMQSAAVLYQQNKWPAERLRLAVYPSVPWQNVSCLIHIWWDVAKDVSLEDVPGSRQLLFLSQRNHDTRPQACN